MAGYISTRDWCNPGLVSYTASTNPTLNLEGDIFTNAPGSANTTTRQVDQSVTPASQVAPTSETLPVLSDLFQQTITSVLETWTTISSYEWSSSDTAIEPIPPADISDDTGHVFRLDFPENYFSDSLVKSKISWFKYIKGDFVFNLKVNAMPQQQGMLFLYWEPFRNDPFYGTDSSAWGARYMGGLAQITTYRGVYLNLEETDSAELRVPFLFPVPYFDLTRYGSLGELRCAVIAPLRGEEDVPIVDVVLNAKLENAELRIPTSRVYDWGAPSPTRVDDSDVAKCEIGDEKPESGVVTKLSGVTANIAETIGDVGIPIVSSVASKVGWAARLIGNAASSLGFSKPDTVHEAQFFTRVPGFSAQLMEGITPCQNMGMIQDNAVKHDNQGEDEMDFAWLCSQRTLINSQEIDLTTQNNRGDIWYQTRVHPIAPDYTYQESEVCLFANPMGVIAAHFDLWRGIVTYHFTLSKTKFVKGRLQVSFIPDNIDYDVSTVPNINRVYTKIWDVGESAHLDFEVPFVEAEGFLPTAEQGFTGIIVVSVFNKFVKPTNVSDKIQLITGVSMQDPQFIMPTMQIQAAYDRHLPIAAAGEVAKAEIGEIAGNQWENKFVMPNITEQIGGEFPSNVRQLCKKFGTLGEDANTRIRVPMRQILTMFALERGSTRAFSTYNGSIFPKYFRFGSEVEIPFGTSNPWFTSPDGVSFFTLPYYERAMARPTLGQWPLLVDAEGGSVAGGVAIGDDYSAWGLRAARPIVKYITY